VATKSPTRAFLLTTVLFHCNPSFLSGTIIDCRYDLDQEHLDLHCMLLDIIHTSTDVYEDLDILRSFYKSLIIAIDREQGNGIWREYSSLFSLSLLECTPNRFQWANYCSRLLC
jgi:hypothetical protein